MADKTVFVKVGAKVDGAVAGLRKLKGSVDDLTKADLKKPQAAFDGISNKAALAGGVVALGIGKAISSFADFDSAMSAASAATGETGAAMQSLRDLAVKAGQETQFSATEAAQGITEMAKAGVSATDILNGGLKGGLALAAAGQLDVAQASEIAATALNQFKLKGTDVAHVADLYSAAAGKAQGSVQDVALAMKYAGVTANSMGVSIEETTGTIALFASKGIIGEQAGTSFRSMLLSLTSPSEKAAGVMEDLGINVYDASGKFVGMQGAADQLQKRLGPLDEKTRNLALGQIFGNESMNAAIALYQGGGKAVSDWTTKVNEAGFATDQAAKLTDNLKGDIERLGGSIETAFINTGSSANDGLRTLTRGLEDVVNIVGGLPGPLLLATTGFAGLALTLPKGISLYRDAASQLDTVGLSIDKISAKAPRAAKALQLLGRAGLVAGVASVAVSIQEVGAASEVADVSVDKLAASLSGLSHAGELQGGIADLFRDEGGLLKGREAFVSTADAIERFNATAFDALSDGALAATVRMLQPGSEAKFDKYVESIDGALAEMVNSGNIDGAKASLEALLAGIDDPQVADAARARFVLFAAAVKETGSTAEVAGPQLGEMSEDVKAVEQNADDAKKALDDLTATIEGFGSPLAAQRAAQRDYQDSIDSVSESIKKQREELIKAREDELASGKASQSSLDALDKAKLRASQAQEKLNAVEAKGTSGQKLSARQALEKANLALSQAQDKVATSTGKLTEADRRAAEKYADAKLKETNLLDINTEAGRTNQAALDNIRATTLKAAAATFELTKSSKLTEDAVKAGRAEFVKAATQLGLNATQANELADSMGLIPKDVATQISLSGVQTANTQLDGVTGKMTTLDKTTAKPQVKPFVNKSTADAVEARIDQLARQRNAFISISAGLTGAASSLLGGISNIGGSIFKRAQGGPISGVGTATSDSNLLLASKGEHVLTAAEVAAAGGHGAIFALRKALLSGGVEFRAQGGPIAAPLSAYRSAPVSSGGGHRGPSAREIAAAMASVMPPQLSVHSGEDARSAARTAIRDWEWGQTQ